MVTKPKILNPESESGVVLVVVIFITAILAVLVLQFSYLIGLDAKMASQHRVNLEAYYLAKAGLHQAIAMLEDDKLTDTGGEEEEKVEGEEESSPADETDSKTAEEGCDDLEEDWAQPQEAVELGSGQFVFKIVDEDRKLNVNLLAHGAVEAVEEIRGKEEKKEGEEGEGEEEKKEVADKEEKNSEEEGEKAEQLQSDEEEEEETKIDEKVKEMLTALFDKLKVKLPQEIVENIIDWIDTDDDGDAEEEYYSSLDPEYHCKNGPMETLGELALIKGIEMPLFRGDTIREKIETVSTEEQPVSYPEEEGFPGLKQYLTVYSNGQVNVNTAPLEVLEILLGEDYEEIAEEIIKARDELPFKQVDEIQDALDEDIPEAGLERLKVKSDYFNILSEGRVGEVAVRIRAVVRRLEEKVKIVYWKIES